MYWSLYSLSINTQTSPSVSYISSKLTVIKNLLQDPFLTVADISCREILANCVVPTQCGGFAHQFNELWDFKIKLWR